MAKQEPDDNVVIEHPNREKASSKATKSGTILLLLVSAALVFIITAGGWASLQGAQFVSVLYVIIYLVMAYFIARWSRGVLPLVAALAIILLVFAAIAAPGWFSRDATGYDNPGIPPGLIGLLTVVLIPVQILLIAFAMRGFSQKWNVEVERRPDDPDRSERSGGYGGGYEPAPQT
jgi:hypothetical protein